GGFALAVVILLAFILATEPLRFYAYQTPAVAVRSATVPAAPPKPADPPPPDPMRIALAPGSFLPVLDFDPTKADATHGGALYVQYCAGCHGDRGQGHAGQSATLGQQGIYPRLAGQPAAYAYRQLYSFAKGWRQNDVMQAMASGLGPRDWGDVAVYLEGLKGTPSLPAPPIRSDMRELAHAILMLGRPERGVSRCDGCHGPDGNGVAPYFPALGGQDAHYFAAQMEDFRDGRRRNSMLRLMEPVVHGLTPREIEALSLYFQSQGSGSAD
ncbi:MAG TPA: c-type cytochrome, partial [Dongiaceae bacterium]